MIDIPQQALGQDVNGHLLVIWQGETHFSHSKFTNSMMTVITIIVNYKSKQEN